MEKEKADKVKYKMISVIGVGNMGRAIVKALLNACFLPGRIIVSDIDRKKVEDLVNKRFVRPADNNIAAADAGEIIIVAVKPQDLGIVLKEIAPELTEDKLLISIAGGVPLEKILKYIRQGKNYEDLRVVRVMPNICAIVGQAMTEICVDSPYMDKKFASKEDLMIVQEIFSACGKVKFVPEEMMSAVTGTAGCTPAFVALVASALKNGGIEAGLSVEESLVLVGQVMKGVGEMILNGYNPDKIIEMVCSPGGITIQGIESLEKSGIRGYLMEAVKKTAGIS
jgi:pyrroline-5-carboxylate reductase